MSPISVIASRNGFVKFDSFKSWVEPKLGSLSWLKQQPWACVGQEQLGIVFKIIMWGTICLKPSTDA